MTTEQKRRYEVERKLHPFMSAQTALRIAKAVDARGAWDEDGHGRYRRELEHDLYATLEVQDESIYPKDGEYGQYVKEDTRGYNYDWNGQWPAPAEPLPLGLPYTAFRYHGPGWVQGEGSGYFIPEGVQETYAWFRHHGQSKSVAWDLTRADVEEQLSMLFSSPLTYATVTVTVWHDGTPLGSASIGTTYCGFDYPFEVADEHGLLDEAMDEATDRVNALRALDV